MKPPLWLLSLALALASAGCGFAQTVDGASFGPTRLAAPAGAPLGFLLLFSNGSGWSAEDDRSLVEFAARGALAVGVDTKIYLENLRARRNAVRPAECVDVFQDVEDLSRRVQGQHPAAFYNPPIVAGAGEGGALAYLALAQAAKATVTGAISLDPTLRLPLSRPLCRLDAFSASPGGEILLGAAPSLNGEWRVAFDNAAEPSARAVIEAFAHEKARIDISTWPETRPADPLVALAQLQLDLAATRGVDALPLIELPSARPSRTMVVLISGDGGWRDLDKTIGEKLQSLGVPVVGWDSLRYFWSRKSPEQTTADVAAVISAYGAKWGAQKVALVGYSFGADVLPVVYNRLQSNVRDRVALISLLGLEAKADWEIRVVGWFGAQPSDAATPLAPEFARIPGNLVQCFYGVKESDSDCLQLDRSQTELVEMPGAHHFGQAYDALADHILEGLKRRGAL